MAFRRRFARRRRGYRRKYRRGGLKKMVKRVIDSRLETKYVDLDIGGTASTSGIHFVNFNSPTAITQGTGNNQRIGNRIKLLGFRYQIEANAGDNFNVCRLMFLHRFSGASLGANPVAITALLGPVNTDAFRVLRDYLTELRYVPVNGAVDASVPQSKFYKGYIKFPKIIEYTPGASDPTRGGMVGLQFHSDSTLAPNPGIGGYVRLYYKDA